MARHERTRESSGGKGMNGRRGFLAKAGGAVASPLLLGALARPASAQATPDGQSVVVRTSHGQVRGVRSGGLAIFKGIPYAGSPAGEGRFKAPPRLAPWSGVRDALVYGPQAIQPPDPGWPKEWTPAATERGLPRPQRVDARHR